MEMSDVLARLKLTELVTVLTAHHKPVESSLHSKHFNLFVRGKPPTLGERSSMIDTSTNWLQQETFAQGWETRLENLEKERDLHLATFTGRFKQIIS